MENIIIIVSVLLVINVLLLLFSVNSTTDADAQNLNNRDGPINENSIKGALPKDLQGYLKILKEDYVVGLHYVEGKTALSEPEWYVSEYDGKTKKTIGKQNADYQIVAYNNNAQPLYALINAEGENLVPPKAYDLGIQNFVEFLESGLEQFSNNEVE